MAHPCRISWKPACLGRWSEILLAVAVLLPAAVFGLPPATSGNNKERSSELRYKKSRDRLAALKSNN
jgi:hypothetical protein